MLNRVFYVIPIQLCTALGIGCTPEVSYEQLTYHNNVVFYRSPVAQEEAQKVVDLYAKNKYFTDESETNIQLRKESGNYEIRAVAKIKPSDQPADYTFRSFDYETFMELACFQNKYALPDANLTYVITQDDDFEKVLQRYPSHCNSNSIGKNIVFGNNSFFHLAPVEQAEALKIMNHLINGLVQIYLIN